MGIVAEAVAGIVHMGSKGKLTVSWSGGKDITLALAKVVHGEQYEVHSLHCIFNNKTMRVGMHGVHVSLIEAQASALNIPLVKVYSEASMTNDAYEDAMLKQYRSFRKEGVTHVLFGDIFLSDLREYRETLLSQVDLIPVFPLWAKPSAECVDDFVSAGFEAVVCAANKACYDAGVLGSLITRNFHSGLPSGTDPAGENGEFHSFVTNGPLFSHPIAVRLGEKSEQSYKFSTLDGDQQTPTIRESKMYFQELLL